MQITFENIYTLGHVISENNLYSQIHYPEMLTRYDSNFIEFKQIPTLTEFKKAESYLREFHLKHGQNHLKFYFPPNEKPAEELIDYMDNSGYEIGFLELYAIEPNQFPSVIENPDIEIHTLSDNNLESFLTLQYQQDLENGRDFANQNQELHKRNFKNPNIQQLLASYKGTPAGSVDIIIKQNTAEIDGLVVNENFQKKGIGSRLQKFVMDQFSNKTIILVADGEDTPREMYRRQNYQYQGFKYQSHKVYED
ncbi:MULTISPECIES: GNAT family N-acetyltransferase [Bacillaceae]|uniref:GNAT family N-acetyltransferase n=1 Tax=Bacillaceae TaxID=186817 RepID=UPI00118A7AD0|nr:GNAT family N-acetyltransferase [Bacillus sp. S3]QCJ42883.1 GNAT family N-acetyltransferase [Bacillus sp. S3]